MPRIFVSDLHLDASAPEAIEQFIELLRTHASRAEALYILGDLFETWIGDDDPEPAKSRVRTALRELTSTGVACFVIHGNRDFLLGSRFCEATGCELLPDPVVAEMDGQRILLTHGDVLCTGDRSYQELRSIVRTPGWQRRFLALPLEARARLADRAREGSKAHTSKTNTYIMDVDPRAVEAAFRVADVRCIVHGHTHRPAMHELVVDGERARRIVLGAWYEQGSYLWYDRGTFELREIPRQAGAPAATGGPE